MHEITVIATSTDTFTVELSGPPPSTHQVRVPASLLERLGHPDPAVLVEQSFEFLLEREPNTAILATFALDVIAEYFPEYEQDLRRTL